MSHVDPLAAITARHDQDLLGGVTILQTTASVAVPAASWSTSLYRPLADTPPAPEPTAAPLTLIPYHVWANREPGPMEVWLRTTL